MEVTRRLVHCVLLRLDVLLSGCTFCLVGFSCFFFNIVISDKLCITKFAQKCTRGTSQVARLIDCRQAGLSRAALTIARIRFEKQFLSV